MNLNKSDLKIESN